MKQQQTHKPILVLGAGSWGVVALALLLDRNGSDVRLWSYDPHQVELLNTQRENQIYLPGVAIPESVHISNDLETLIDGVTDILICVPSPFFLQTLLLLKKAKPQGLRIAWGTKGLDPESHRLLGEVVVEHYGRDTPMAIISGPSFAKEVVLSLPTAVSLAGNNADFNRDMIESLHSAMFRVYENPDFVGVELCGVIKNVLAIGVGICDGMGFGANARSALITRGLAEMTRLCEAIGGQSQTVMSLAGIGDLVLTCTDDQSRNRRFGLAMGRECDAEVAKREIGQAIEGYTNAKQLYELAESHHVEMPIVDCLYRILYEGADIKQQVSILMGRDPRGEHI